MELDPTRMFTFLITMVVTYFVIDIFKILLAKQLRNHLNQKNIRLIKKFISIVLIASGIFLLSQGWFPKEQKIVNKAFEKFEDKK